MNDNNNSSGSSDYDYLIKFLALGIVCLKLPKIQLKLKII